MRDAGAGPQVMGASTSSEGLSHSARGPMISEIPPQPALMDLTVSPYRDRSISLAKKFLKSAGLKIEWIDTPTGTSLIDSVINNIAANLSDGPLTFTDDMIWQVIGVEFLEMKKKNGRAWDHIDLQIPASIPEEGVLDPAPQLFVDNAIEWDPPAPPGKGPSLQEVALGAPTSLSPPPGLHESSKSVVSDISTHESEILIEAAEVVEEVDDGAEDQSIDPESAPDRGAGVTHLIDEP